MKSSFQKSENNCRIFISDTTIKNVFFLKSVNNLTSHRSEEPISLWHYKSLTGCHKTKKAKRSWMISGCWFNDNWLIEGLRYIVETGTGNYAWAVKNPIINWIGCLWNVKVLMVTSLSFLLRPQTKDIQLIVSHWQDKWDNLVFSILKKILWQH